MPVVGERAPAFSARLTTGEQVSLDDYRGKYLVLYFFPKAFTPGCTRQARRFRDAYPDIKVLGAEVIGLSVDDFETQCDFAEKMEATFPMIADADREISKRYGVLRSWLKWDKRITFVIDPEGVVVGVFHHEFQVSKHLDQVVHLLEKLVKR